MEELILQLTEPAIHTTPDGIRRATAKAQLIYSSTGQNREPVDLTADFSFTAPLGPIEKDDLRWNLERYHQWPSGVFKQRAEKIEEQIPHWGAMIYNAVFDQPGIENILTAWNRESGQTERRFAVLVDEKSAPEPGTETGPTASVAAALLDRGVSSVVAMSHSVLVETARRFVTAFYREKKTVFKSLY